MNLPTLWCTTMKSIRNKLRSGYENPVIRGLNPDPTVCRVGRDYYLATSTMNTYPGIPLYHSRDLVNWKCIGHALTRKPHFFLSKNRGNPMIYAPTLRYSQGRFYLITTDVHGGGNFFVTAEDPSGSWSDPVVVDQPMFDPSLFWDDDGTIYYTRRGEFKDKDIVQAEIDINSGRLLTPMRSIARGMVSDDTEGPHLFKAHGWYYLTCGEGGSRFLHMQTIGRSPSPWGPFEPCPHNPVIAQHHAWWHPVKSLGHADFFEAHDGSWWAVCLGTRHYDYNALSTIGRETFLFPVEWRDGWPFIQQQWMQKLFVDKRPFSAVQELGSAWQDDFDDDILDPQWTLPGFPGKKLYTLNERPGWLRLFGQADAFTVPAETAFIGKRQTEYSFIFETALEFTPRDSRDRAGICLFLSPQFYYEFCKTRKNGYTVIMLRKKVGDMETEIVDDLDDSEGKLYLRVQAEPQRYLFSYARRRGQWKETGEGQTRLLTTELAGVWSGMLAGLLSSCAEPAAENPADFDYCSMKVL